MIKFTITLSILLMALFFTACTKDSRDCDCPDSLPYKLDTMNIESSMKGWELYSWPGDEEDCSNFNYSLLPGTNKLKSYNEVTNVAVLKVTGEKQLKLLLSKFPVNEEILWVGENWLDNIWGLSNINYGNLKLPLSSVLNEIQQHCTQKGLRLTISQ